MAGKKRLPRLRKAAGFVLGYPGARKAFLKTKYGRNVKAVNEFDARILGKPALAKAALRGEKKGVERISVKCKGCSESIL